MFIWILIKFKLGYTARPLWNEWKICGKKERVRVEKERSLIKKQYEQILDIMAFGILKITNFVFEILETKQVKKIKRSIHSGKRCINWTKPALTELAAIAINTSNTNQSVFANIRRSKGGNKK